MKRARACTIVSLQDYIFFKSIYFEDIGSYYNIKSFICLTDRVGGRTLSVELKTGAGTDTWDLGGQWVGKSV